MVLMESEEENVAALVEKMVAVVMGELVVDQVLVLVLVTLEMDPNVAIVLEKRVAPEEQVVGGVVEEVVVVLVLGRT